MYVSTEVRVLGSEVRTSGPVGATSRQRGVNAVLFYSLYWDSPFLVAFRSHLARRRAIWTRRRANLPVSAAVRASPFRMAMHEGDGMHTSPPTANGWPWQMSCLVDRAWGKARNNNTASVSLAAIYAIRISNPPQGSSHSPEPLNPQRACYSTRIPAY